MEITDYRNKIDAIDEKMVKLFCERMELAKDIASYKKENGLPVLDTERERKLLDKVEDAAGSDMGDYTRRLYTTALELSRSYQNSLNLGASALTKSIEDALSKTPQLFPEKAVVACQGVEGAYSVRACEKLFEKPSVMYFQTFDAVFKAVEKGFCEYGVVPLENSTAGSVNMTYSLMDRYRFHIVRSTKIQIEHCLLTQNGTKLGDIKKVYSHPQAIEQCSVFLDSLGKDVEVIPCENTAMAAKRVSETGAGSAAIASEKCCAEYNLSAAEKNIQNTDNNYTRFICFSKDIKIFPGADKTSLLVRTPHRVGALYHVMAQLYSNGINILKLESRPIPGSDFEFMFYFDLEGSVYSKRLLNAIRSIENTLGTQNVKYLGSYREK